MLFVRSWMRSWIFKLGLLASALVPLAAAKAAGERELASGPISSVLLGQCTPEVRRLETLVQSLEEEKARLKRGANSPHVLLNAERLQAHLDLFYLNCFYVHMVEVIGQQAKLGAVASMHELVGELSALSTLQRASGQVAGVTLARTIDSFFAAVRMNPSFEFQDFYASRAKNLKEREDFLRERLKRLPEV